MKLDETELPGAYVLELDRRADERGWFARLWDPEVFRSEGLDPRVAQISVAWNDRKDTLRGLHFQEEPYGEAKLIRCTRGAIHDVLVDLRSDSAAYLKWFAVELTEDDPHALYVPEGVAHGYQTLVDGTETLYLISEAYRPEAQRGVRWDDPAFGIEWPNAVDRVMSERDRTWPDFNP